MIGKHIGFFKADNEQLKAETNNFYLPNEDTDGNIGKK